MELITMILSGLALLAATVCLILHFQEKKRNEKRNAESLKDDAKAYQEELNYRESVSMQMGALLDRIEKLEKGVIPDYDEAVKATEAVDDLSKYISQMLNFDPLEEARKARIRRSGKEGA